MKQLEEFIKNNRDSFDDELPSGDLWEKIEAKLENKSVRPVNTIRIVSAIAAMLVVALLTTFMINRNTNKDMKFSGKLNPEMQELLETEAYYASMVNGKMSEIEKCYNIYPELKSDIEADLQELDMMYRELRNDLNDNYYNREVIEAMIQNNRVRLEMVSRVLNQINC
jgi:hypothetical protein